jgi:PAS domain S-box-containing protein
MNTQIAKEDFLKRLAQIVLKMDDLDAFFHSITRMLVDVFAVAWATLSLLDESSNQYKFRATSRREEGLKPQDEATQNEESLSWLRDRQRILSQRLKDEFGTRLSPHLKEEIDNRETSVSIPLFAAEKLIGILNLGSPAAREGFSKEDLERLTELAELLASVISQACQHQRVAEQRRHHQNILDNLVSGIVAIDPEDKVTVFNRAAERILGVRAEEVLGEDVHKLQANLANLLLDTLHRDKSYKREELYVFPENALIGVSTSQFYDAKGKLLGACMVFSSIAEIKKDERLKRQENLNTYWSNVANSLAHEIKNSIMAAKVFTEMFPKKYDDAEFRWNLYSTLKRDMARLDNFTEKVLNFAQGHQMLMQSYQIDKLLNSAIDTAIEGRDLGQLSFEKRYSRSVESLQGDYHRLKEAFAQIISNALEAMGKQGTLSISAEQESGPEMMIYNLPKAINELPKGEMLVVKISDTGCGIAEEDLPKLFDPFFTTKQGRSGLGLAFARKIIEKHGGSIHAKSKAEEGTTLWIFLPVKKMESADA